MNNEKKSLARYLCVQAIYQILISEKPFQEVIDEFLNFRVKNFSENFEFLSNMKKKTVDTNYFLKIMKNFENSKEKIKDIIASNLEASWTFQRLPFVLKAILTVCVSEMMVSKELSIGIIASEYIILSETFCSENESAFVNALIENFFKCKNVEI